MLQGVDLKKIERNAFMTYFKDGWWDILLGIFLLGWGLGILTDTAGLTGVWVIAAFWITWGLKRRLTQPRIGHVKVTMEKKTLSWLAIGGVATLVLGIVAYFLFTSGSNFLVGYFMLLFGGILAIVTCAIAYWWKVNRWYVYAALILFGVSSYQWLDFSLPLSFIIPGSLIILSGLTVLIRFLHNNPINSENVVQ